MRAYRVPAAAVLLMLVAGCQAFVMPPSQRTSAVPTTGAPTTTARAAFGMVDSFHLMDALASSASATFSSISLADALESVDVDAATTAAAAATSSADAAAEASSNPGWFGFLTGPIEGLLQIIHSVLVTVGVSSDAWGVSIIMMTVIIKILTFPLTKTQLESTNKMQMIQPAVKDLQAKYQSNPEVMNQKIAELYQTNEINPLAGCLPSLVQIPVFIGLYRAVLELAKDNKLDEPFLWLPNLEGPTYGADPTHGSDWILTGWCVASGALQESIERLFLSRLLSLGFVSPRFLSCLFQTCQG
jgi:YidC/Oxa1 family membrane protein insertase